MSLAEYHNPTLTVEANEHCDSQMVKFRELLPQLDEDIGIMLCYVATNTPVFAPISSPIGISITPTLGGMRYGISEYSHGRRGSGAYYEMEGDDLKHMEADILKRLRWHHRTTPLTTKYGKGNHHLNQFMLIRKP